MPVWQRTPRTMLDKVWADHEVGDELLYVDLHLVHEVTSAQAFEGLRLAGRRVRRPDRTLATADHNVSDRARASPTSCRARSSRRSTGTARSSGCGSTRSGTAARAWST